MPLSSIQFYGIKGFHPGILGLIQQTHNTTCGYPHFTRCYIQTKNCALMNESFKTQIRTLPMDLIYPESKLKDIMLIRKTPLDENIRDLAIDDMITNAHPIAILNLKLKPSDDQVSYLITLADFDYYLVYPDKIEKIKHTKDQLLHHQYFMKVNFRISLVNNKRHSEPMDIFIFATSAWNKKSISDFAELADFIDPSDVEQSIVYKSYEDPMIYTMSNIFLMINVPIKKDQNSKIVHYDGIPQYELITENKSKPIFPSVLYFKIQNYRNDDKKQYIKDCLKTIVNLALDNVNNIDSEHKYKESAFDAYKAFVNHMMSFIKTKTPDDPYNLDTSIQITDEHKSLIYEQLELILKQL